MEKEAKKIAELLDLIRANKDFNNLHIEDQKSIFTANDKINLFLANIHESIDDKTKKYQVNNIKIQYSRIYDKWACWSGKRCLEEFSTLQEAKDWCKETKDFLTKK